ncbi:hypothetical protein GPY61_15530 [Massilia sp. NEAU-DD11]|uniref:Uncharacterized protein n=1 Tax=Massilia cellulosiltytica TaxID=2683234 RepID=A0A7X3K8I3_9BURK|nr:hypothetical protein [Telluria cellulosilytica]
MASRRRDGIAASAASGAWRDFGDSIGASNARGTSEICGEQDLQARVDADPFVVHGVVQAEILEIKPGKADPRLEFLLQ